jgi:hypothetical protein
MHIKITNGTPTTYSIGQLRRDNPQVSFPKNPPDELLAEYGVFPVKELARPDHDTRTHYLKQSEFYQVEGRWQVHYVPEQLPQAQVEDAIRAERDQLLAASDWTQVADAPVDQSAWAAYRQALREIPQQDGFPYDVIWPTVPQRG